jgi:uncharacterized protein (TIGR00730 family)
MNKLQSICVFCGSSPGKEEVYASQARVLGKAIAAQGSRLIYGGGNIGLMGIIANTVLEAGGTVTGVLPKFLNRKEVGHVSLSELILVDSMHERKQRMSDLSSAFIAMPGGFGTLEEIAEMLTWTQLGLSTKPLGFYNINRFYDPLASQFDKMVQEGFLKPDNRKISIFDADADRLLEKLIAYEPRMVPKWLKPDQT